MTETNEGFIEYRVKPVTRFIVTRYEQAQNGSGGITARGEFDNFDTAYAVGYALAKAEHDRLGYPLDDMRIRYPEPIIHASDCSLHNAPALESGPCDCQPAFVTHAKAGA